MTSASSPLPSYRTPDHFDTIPLTVRSRCNCADANCPQRKDRAASTDIHARREFPPLPRTRPSCILLGQKNSPLVPATRGTSRCGNADGEKHGCGYIPLGGQSLGFAAISDLLDEGRDDLVNITNDADIGDLKDGCVLVLVDHHDAL